MSKRKERGWIRITSCDFLRLTRLKIKISKNSWDCKNLGFGFGIEERKGKERMDDRRWGQLVVDESVVACVACVGKVFA